jgi:hypothetical protein
MSKGMWASTWLFSLVVAAYLGYLIGHKGAEQALVTEGRQYAAQPIIQPVPPGETSSNADDVLAIGHSSSKVSPAVQISASAQAPEREKAKRLADTGKAFAQSQTKNVGRDHYEQGREFAKHFTENDSDWQAKTNITDFLQLHEDVERIDLQKIICDERRCQLIGQYAGQHQNWQAVLDAMREQDWWDYTGTSSSSQSDNEQTYFNVYLDKPESQSN